MFQKASTLMRCDCEYFCNCIKWFQSISTDFSNTKYPINKSCNFAIKLFHTIFTQILRHSQIYQLTSHHSKKRWKYREGGGVYICGNNSINFKATYPTNMSMTTFRFHWPLRHDPGCRDCVNSCVIQRLNRWTDLFFCS